MHHSINHQSSIHHSISYQCSGLLVHCPSIAGTPNANALLCRSKLSLGCTTSLIERARRVVPSLWTQRHWGNKWKPSWRQWLRHKSFWQISGGTQTNSQSTRQWNWPAAVLKTGLGWRMIHWLIDWLSGWMNVWLIDWHIWQVLEWPLW